MKKLLYAAATAAAVFTLGSAEAKQPKNTEIQNYYRNGEIRESRHDILYTGYRWNVKNRNQKQIWYAVGETDKDVTLKLKGNDYKTFGKVKADGEKDFIKDIDPVKRSKHVAKIMKDEERYTAKNITNENGSDVIRESKKK